MPCQVGSRAEAQAVEQAGAQVLIAQASRPGANQDESLMQFTRACFGQFQQGRVLTRIGEDLAIMSAKSRRWQGNSTLCRRFRIVSRNVAFAGILRGKYACREA